MKPEVGHAETKVPPGIQGRSGQVCRGTPGLGGAGRYHGPAFEAASLSAIRFMI
jgi:hypothetical protein